MFSSVVGALSDQGNPCLHDKAHINENIQDWPQSRLTSFARHCQHRRQETNNHKRTNNPRYNDKICSQRCCQYNDFAVVRVESLIDRMICKEALVLFIFSHRTYVLDICEAILTNPKHVSLKYQVQYSYIICDLLLPIKRRFRDSKIVIITNFVVVSSVGINRIDCTNKEE